MFNNVFVQCVFVNVGVSNKSKFIDDRLFKNPITTEMLTDFLFVNLSMDILFYFT